MTMQMKRILNEVLELNPVEKVELIDKILSSFTQDEKGEYEEQWAEEIEPRIKAYQEGKITARPLSDVLSGLK